MIRSKISLIPYDMTIKRDIAKGVQNTQLLI
jgi:hypothetical protein